MNPLGGILIKITIKQEILKSQENKKSINTHTKVILSKTIFF